MPFLIAYIYVNRCGFLVDAEGGVLPVYLHGEREIGSWTTISIHTSMWVCINIESSNCRLQISTLSRIFHLEELHHLSWATPSSSGTFLGVIVFRYIYVEMAQAQAL